MSRRSTLLRSFQSDAQLCQFFLEKVTPTGKELGIGSYGSVIEVEYNKKSCAAKQIHEILIQAGNEGIRDTIEKYRRECQLMASLQHPNVTRFLGLCFLESSHLPLLVMERLEMSVDDLLEGVPNIALSLKLSVLTDTCRGLHYLHDRKSPIVHRDLTARNVLLTSSLVAKIADLGNSRIVNFKSGQLAKTLSKNPGTTVYMPPEALNETHRYGPSLDTFSFGHLSLYTLTQVFPGELLAAAYASTANPDRIIGRSEVERRASYVSTMESTFGQTYPELVDMVKQCLHNVPEKRPLIKNTLSKLKDVVVKVERKDGLERMKDHYRASILCIKNLKGEKDRRINELEISCQRLEADNTELMSINEQIRAEKVELMARTEILETENRELHNSVEVLRTEKQGLKANKSRCEALSSQLTDQLQYLQGELGDLKRQIEEKEQQLQHAHRQLKSNIKSTIEETSHMTFPLQLDWKSVPDMPFAMAGFIQAVKVEGTVYVGGGSANSNEYCCTVMVFDLHSCKWSVLPSYGAKLFAMTSIKNNLVLVGGLLHNVDVSEIGMWHSVIKKWIYPYPPMPTPRYYPSATSFKQWLVVAGGENEHDYLSTVEILDLDNKQWSTGPSTPVPWYRMKSVVVDGTWYLLGGMRGSSNISDVYMVSLEALVSYSSSDSLPIWKTLTNLDSTYSYPLNIGGYVVAVAGIKDNDIGKNVITMQCYVSETDTWVSVGELPNKFHSCAGCVSSHQLYLMGGHNGKKYLNSVFSSTSC